MKSQYLDKPPKFWTCLCSFEMFLNRHWRHLTDLVVSFMAVYHRHSVEVWNYSLALCRRQGTLKSFRMECVFCLALMHCKKKEKTVPWVVKSKCQPKSWDLKELVIKEWPLFIGLGIKLLWSHKTIIFAWGSINWKGVCVRVCAVLIREDDVWCCLIKEVL